MKYNLSGFNQELLMMLSRESYRIDFIKTPEGQKPAQKATKYMVIIQANDLYLLDWFIDVWTAGKASHFVRRTNPFDDKEYINIHYEKTAEYFPLLFKNKNNVKSSFVRLTYLGLLLHWHYKEKGSFSYFRPNEEVISLIRYKNSQTTDEEYAENKRLLIEYMSKKTVVISPLNKFV